MNESLLNKIKHKEELIDKKKDIIDGKKEIIESLKKENSKLAKKLFKLKVTQEYKTNESVDMNMIDSKCEIYYNLFIRVYDKLTVTKKRLDLYQLFLNRINSGIQLSVITLSIASSFIQALDSKTYEIFFNTDGNVLNGNNTLDEAITTYDSNVNESNYSSMVSIITLSISTYSALIIAAERHFGLQQRETNVEKLKDLYTEPISRIRTNLEQIRPWRYKGYYTNTVNKKETDENDTDTESGILERAGSVILDPERTIQWEFDDEKKKDWISMIDKLDKEYIHVIDVKKELDTSLEKMINVKTLKSYQASVPRKERTIGLEAIKEMDTETKYDNNKRKRWCRILCCRKKNVNHTYDEEDLNHFEDKIETEKVNEDRSKINDNYNHNEWCHNYKRRYDSDSDSNGTIDITTMRLI